MLAFPNCKINLGLSITEKRADNYHNLETVFYPVPLYDVLEIIESQEKKTRFASEGIPVPGDISSNLCLKAYELISKDYRIPAVDISLIKNIPMGAGLGGGSSDAAFTLKLLNDLFELKITDEKLIGYASVLGADCAFFIKNKAMFAHGIGNLFQEIELNLESYYMVLIKPPVHISTAEAYSGIIPSKKSPQVLDIIKSPLHTWKNHLINDFEKSIFKNHEEIKFLKNYLYAQGAVYASMSGSGSSVFGLFEKEVDFAEDFTDCFYWSGFLK